MVSYKQVLVNKHVTSDLFDFREHAARIGRAVSHPVAIAWVRRPGPVLRSTWTARRLEGALCLFLLLGRAEQQGFRLCGRELVAHRIQDLIVDRRQSGTIVGTHSSSLTWYKCTAHSSVPRGRPLYSEPARYSGCTLFCAGLTQLRAGRAIFFLTRNVVTDCSTKRYSTI